MSNFESTGNAVPEPVDAELEWPVQGRPPEIMLSFDGLHQPVQLWAELASLGWIVPPCPPPPGSAISWTPDPVAGTDYTITSWRVREFRLGRGQWTPEQRDAVSDRTVAVLQKHGVRINGQAAPAAAVAPTAPAAAVAPTAPAAAVGPNAPAATAPQSEVNGVVLTLDPTPAVDEELPPGVQSWVAISGREKRACTWVERTNGAPDAVALETLYERSGQAWLLDSPLPGLPTANRAAIHIVVTGKDSSESKVGKLAQILGDQVVTVGLTPLSPKGQPAVLICASVAANVTDMLLSSLRLRYPKAVIRLNT